jgi:hypothetical protein
MMDAETGEIISKAKTTIIKASELKNATVRFPSVSHVGIVS